MSVLPLCCYGKVLDYMIKKTRLQKQTYTYTVKTPRKCVAMPTIHIHCATHFKPQTKKTGKDSSNACFCLYTTQVTETR